ncbi:MAG: WYL domain-containing protein [Aquiluna sp.]|nr:WYL domain-containing protein [Aquiluna sp.]
MPKQEIDAEGLFNLSLSIVGLVLKDGPMLTSELARHFGFSEKTITKAVLTIANSEDVGRYETHFYVDEELLSEGEVDFSTARSSLDRPPLLSKRQTTALAAGLDYLAAMPQFLENTDLKEVREIIGSGSAPITSYQPVGSESVLLEIQRSVDSRMQISAEYVNQLGVKSVRTIDPLRVEFIGKRHYLRGWCHTNLEVRSFRIDRIISAKTTGGPISEEALAADIPVEVFGAVSDELIVEIQASSEASEIFWNFPALDVKKAADGSSSGKIRVGNLQALGRHVCRYGGEVLVLGPPEAREAVTAFARKALGDQSIAENED